MDDARTDECGPALTMKVAVWLLLYSVVLPQVQVWLFETSTEILPSTIIGTPAARGKVNKLHRVPENRQVLRTAELCTDSDCEAGTVFESARVGDAPVDTETHLLLGARIVRKHLLRNHDRRRGDDPADVDIEFDPFDCHILPYEVEELASEGTIWGVVRKGGLRGRARVQRQTFCGRDEAEVVRILARTRHDLEPAIVARQAADLSPIRKVLHSLVIPLTIARDMIHSRNSTTRNEDPAG